MIDRAQRAAELMAFDLPYKSGGIVVAGMDEVGRGPLAGNVVTACVVMPDEPVIPWIDDSKKLSESRREKLFEEIDVSEKSAYRTDMAKIYITKGV